MRFIDAVTVITASLIAGRTSGWQSDESAVVKKAISIAREIEGLVAPQSYYEDEEGK